MEASGLNDTVVLNVGYPELQTGCALASALSRPGRMRCTEVGAGICDQFNHEMQLLMVGQVELAQTWRQPTGTQEITLAIKELEVITTHHLGDYVLYCKRKSKLQVVFWVAGGATIWGSLEFPFTARGGNPWLFS